MKKLKYSTLAQINVTSLVDVTMVLLIIFMITAPMLRSGIEVNLPRAKVDALKESDGITVSLTPDRQIFLDADLIKEAEFEIELARRFRENPNKAVFIQADQAIPYGEVIHLIDRIKSVGIHNVGLIVESNRKK
ncbi:ExbD/TolR family protein [candidate division KSB1 bacterium]|nr:ExbD/TolR family protein [candidate division KSB1 bacterium]